MPVTWIWGPVASLNVASTLAPALTAFTAFVVRAALGPLDAGRLHRRAALRLLALRAHQPASSPTS